MMWITNGKDSMKVDETFTMPEGWRKGRTITTFWCNNGEQELQVHSETEIPEGYVKGRVKTVCYTDNNVTIKLKLTDTPPEGFIKGKAPTRKLSEQEELDRRAKIKASFKSKSTLEKQEAVEKAQNTKQQRYGSSTYNNITKRKETNQLLYNDKNYSNRTKFIETMNNKSAQEKSNINEARSKTLTNFYDSMQGEERVEFFASRLQKSQSTCLARYDTKSFSQSSEFVDKFKESCQKSLGVDFPAQSRKVQQRTALNRKRSCVASDGTQLDSSWELAFYEYCLRNNLTIERNIPIEFIYKGEKHITFIDFKVDDLLFEVKGQHLLEGCYDYALCVPIDIKLNIYKENHVVLITDYRDLFSKHASNGLKYLDKCINPLIGIDINLFLDPVFPFDPTKPECFYKVKVDGCESSYEAFFDETLRWKMILNRINYEGKFIDNKSILRAMNVTRICKQPSWFSKNLAKDILTKYSTSSTVVDPFAGWGTRCDASVELGKVYIGSDFNPELVAWHQSRNRSISLQDANNFTYDKECTLFICPPYSDPISGRCFEDYNFSGFDSSAKNLSQCDWLRICMQNVPNAKEYIMVCKIVDPGFEKYIVDTKINRSHFGLNNEYILVVPNRMSI